MRELLGDHYLRTERGYKVAAHDWQDDSGATSWSLSGRAARSRRFVIAREVVNKTNLIFPNEKMG